MVLVTGNMDFLLFSGRKSAFHRTKSTHGSSTYSSGSRRSGSSSTRSTASTASCCHGSERLNLPASEARRLLHGSDSESSTPSPSPTLCASKYDTLSNSSSEEAKPKLISKMGKRNIKAQVKRFRMETKAAKTLGERKKVYHANFEMFGSMVWAFSASTSNTHKCI